MGGHIEVSGGVISSPDQLRSRLAREALQALQGDLGQYWTLIGVMQFENHDLLAMDVTVELPQYPACDLQQTERLALWFHHEDQGIPKVCALRSDFPALPHTINVYPGSPLVICLYTTPPEELRAQLTGQQLLARISQWMRRAARGELHEANQPLQAFFHQSAHQMVLPSSIDFSTTSILSMHVLERETHGVKTTLTGNKGDFGKAGKPALLSLHGLPATEHNTLTRLPATLFDLHQFLQGFGVDLFAPLRREFRTIIEAGGYLEARWYLLLGFPTTRVDGGEVESQDIRVFSPTLTIRELGLQLDWLFQEGETVVRNVLPPLNVLEQSKQVPIEAMNVSFFLSPDAAARFNGADPEDSKMLAIGVGALGSQVLANLTRAGFGRWGAVDDDVFMPHNAARHLLSAIHTGQSKAVEVARVLNQNFDDQDLVRPFHENIFSTPSSELQQVLQEARVIVDFSASVAAARHLALNVQSPARRVSVFLSPSGRDLVVLAEDEGRTFTLDQLETQYYQWLWDNEDLHDHLQRPDDLLWYGTGCRDVSSRLPQDLVALHSATASRALKGILKGKEAGIFLWRASPETGEVTRLTLTPEVPLKYRAGEWTLQVSPAALKKMQALRSADLPGETGGTFIGTRDLPCKTLYVTGVLGAPEDSQKALKTFIRGSRKLLSTYERIRQMTLRNLTYLGEWHSHPDGVPARPSLDDIVMFGWLQEQLGVEGFPALMGIVGEKDHHFFLDDLQPAVPVVEEVQDA